MRQMRRSRQELTSKECDQVLERQTSGVLAVLGDEGYPYAVPLSYVYQGGKIYFHCAKEGHKLDAIRKDNKVSFCVVDQDQVVPEEYTTYFRSVIVFGTARLLEDEKEKRRALEALAAKYSPREVEGREKEIQSQFSRVALVEITPNHITGKEAIELTRKKHPSLL